MRFKMNRLSRAIKRGLVSTEGPTQKRLISSILAGRCLKRLVVGGAAISACFVSSCVTKVDQYPLPTRQPLDLSPDLACRKGIAAQSLGVRQRV